jgi:hypothetical protein
MKMTPWWTLILEGASHVPFYFFLHLEFPPDKIPIILPFFNDSDITALAKDKVYAHIRLDEMSVQQVYREKLSFLYIVQGTFAPLQTKKLVRRVLGPLILHRDS